jgi:hypothetical protein
VRDFIRFTSLSSSQPLSAANSTPERARARTAVGGYLLVAALVIVAVFLHQTTKRAAAIRPHPICARWDKMAADAVAGLVHEPADASSRQAGDDLFMLRRARSNCRAGWLALSCRDYYAIVKLRARTGNETSKGKSLCALAMIQ